MSEAGSAVTRFAAGPVASASPTPTQARDAQARSAIARAAQATGVDFQYLMAQARLESGLDPEARAATSSAAGLFQFTSGTWLGTLDRHGADHGLAWLSDRIDGGRVADGALREQILGLRFNPDAAALMAAELARDNRAELAGVLGRDPDPSELYLAHFLGSRGAQDFLSALSANPAQSAAALMPRAAAANRPIFYAKDGSVRSVAQVMDLLRTKIAGAMGLDGPAPQIAYDASVFGLGEAYPGGNFASGTKMPTAQALLAARGASATGGPLAREFDAARTQAAGTLPAPTAGHAPRSMSDTLKSAFGASETALPGNVRQAYGKLARFGL